jgi:hypothetical protein
MAYKISKTRRWFFSAILIICLIFVLEIILRGASWAVNPDGDGLDKWSNEANIEFEKIPHPYLGFVSRNFNPINTADLDHRQDKFVFTILGGSVVERFCVANREKHIFENLIGEQIKKEVVVDCLGVASYSQPQEAIAAFLYAHDSDFVLSLEGDNELFESKSKAASRFPSNRFKKLFFSDFRTEFFGRNFLFLVATAEIWAHRQGALLDNLYIIKFLKRFVRTWALRYLTSVDQREEVELPERIEIWQEGIRDMGNILAARKTPLLTVFQPLLDTKDQLLPQEAKYVTEHIANDKKRRKEYIEGAQVMIKRLETEGFHFIDYNLRKDFVTEELEFVDDCHFTLQAEEKFMVALAKDVIRELQKIKK